MRWMKVTPPSCCNSYVALWQYYSCRSLKTAASPTVCATHRGNDEATGGADHDIVGEIEEIGGNVSASGHVSEGEIYYSA